MPLLKYRIYQLQAGHPNCFRPYPPPMPVMFSDYGEPAFEGHVSADAGMKPKAIIEKLFVRHNADDRPAADRMRSLSVSDLVMLFDGPVPDKPGSLYYMDTFGSVLLKPDILLDAEKGD